MILWLRAEALDYVVRQRALDSCVLPVLNARCARLNMLSVANRRLRQLILAIAGAEAARTAGSFVPIAGQVAAAAGEGALEALRATARAVARAQDATLEVGRIADLRLLSCGQPSVIPGRLALERTSSPEALLARVPGPLAWEWSPASTELQVNTWDQRTLSFGWCRPRQRPADRKLDGEHYEVRLTHPDRLLSNP